MRPLVAGAGVTGALAFLNRNLRRADLPVNHLGGTQRPWSWRGYDIFATEAGSGPLILLVHGIYAGASSYEFRHVFPLLAKTHRVVAFDLLGCGLSEMPDLEYSAELFVEQIVDALRAFAATEGDLTTTLIGSSLGGAFTIRAAARASDRVGALVAICPTGLRGVLDAPPPPARAALTALVRSPIVGESLWNGLASPPSLRYFLTHQGYADPALATDDVVNHYYAITHQPGARYVPAAFVGGMLNCDVARDLPFVESPVLVAWGEKATSPNPFANANEFVSLAKHGELAAFAHSAQLPHEEEPEAFAAAVEAFLAPHANASSTVS